MYRFFLLAVLMIGLTFAAGCNTVPETEAERQALEARARTTVERFKETDPAMSEHFFQTAAGWAVFPSIGKGGAGLGGAYGRGVLFENGQTPEIVGYCDVSQGSIGFQLGGQAFSEIIFFENERALNSFKTGSFEFSAQASAVAAKADASASADYDEGVAVFTLAGRGLMYEASIGGQDFDYVPKAE